MRNIIYELCGWEQFQDMEADYDTVKAAIEPALDYLRELNPYLWNEGKTFPESSTTVDAMFADGELVMNMSYGPFSVATGIAGGTYTDTTRTFVFDNGTIGNTNYMAIAFNSPNKAGAMVVINAILSAELQLTQYEQLRELPVVSADKLSAEEQAAFDAVDLGKGVLSQAELLKHRLPEMRPIWCRSSRRSGSTRLLENKILKSMGLRKNGTARLHRFLRLSCKI